MNKYSEYSITTYILCPKKYEYTYFIKPSIKKFVHKNFILGRNVHNTCKEFYSVRAEDRSLDMLHDMFRDIWRRGNSKSFFSSREEEKESGQSGLVMLNNFYKKFADRSPYRMEEYIENRFDKYILFGRIDRLDINEDGTFEITDYKTTIYYENEGLARERQTLQIKMYAIMLDSQNRKVSSGSYYYMPEDYFDTIEFDDNKIDYIKKYITDVIEEIETDKSFDRNYGDWCKYCNYKKICMEEESNGGGLLENDESTNIFEA